PQAPGRRGASKDGGGPGARTGNSPRGHGPPGSAAARRHPERKAAPGGPGEGAQGRRRRVAPETGSQTCQRTRGLEGRAGEAMAENRLRTGPVRGRNPSERGSDQFTPGRRAGRLSGGRSEGPKEHALQRRTEARDLLREFAQEGTRGAGCSTGIPGRAVAPRAGTSKSADGTSLCGPGSAAEGVHGR